MILVLHALIYMIIPAKLVQKVSICNPLATFVTQIVPLVLKLTVKRYPATTNEDQLLVSHFQRTRQTILMER